MAFKNEERRDGVIRVNDIWRKSSDEKFEDLIQEIKNSDTEIKTGIARNSFVQVIQNFQYLWDENQSAFIQPLIMFSKIALKIACYGCENISDARIEETINYHEDFAAFKNLLVENKEVVFRGEPLTDDEYQLMINLFLCASLEPLTSSYPNTLFTYMICIACADSYNESGIALIRKLRDDYFEFAPLRKDGKIETFTGRIK